MEIIPKKSMGQHWLNDKVSLDAMVEMAGVQAGDCVVEIGPGLGSLTTKLLEAGARVIAVEFDQILAHNLERNVAKALKVEQLKDRLQVLTQDILSVNFSEFPKDYKVVANIPYYLTSNLIRVLSETDNPPASATLLIQKEVAERVCAGPGKMSILSVSAQMYSICSLGPIVPAELFTPPPKVDSQIVHLERRSELLFEKANEKHFFRIVKAGFSNKRKTLHNSLSAGLQITKDQSKTWLESANINPGARPQELSLDDWLKLTEVISK